MASAHTGRALRWLVVGPFSGSGTGKVLPVAGERFATVMGKLDPRARVQVVDRIGSGDTRSLDLRFPKPTAFRVADVIAAVPELAELFAIADKLGKGGSLQQAASLVQTAVGPGRLLDALRGDPTERATQAGTTGDPTPTHAASDAPTTPAGASAARSEVERGGTSDDPIDAIFAKAASSSRPTSAQGGAAPPSTAAVKSGLDAFVGAMRSSGASSVSKTDATARATGASAAQIIRDAVTQTAIDALSTDEVARLEVAWRSLRMIVSAAPGADDLGIDLLDAAGPEAIDRLDTVMQGPDLARPDAIFCTDTWRDPDALARLADVAARNHVPIAVEIAPESAAADVQIDALPDPPDEWQALRARPSSAWLCAAMNPPALVHEEDPPRLVFGGAAAALAAMASASVGRTAAPGDVFGRSGMLGAPAAHDARVQGSTQTIPTARFCSVTRQRELADRGVTALGSEPGRPELRLAAAPMIGTAIDRTQGDTQLPARILLGRATRLVRAIRDDLPPDAGADALQRAVSEATATFLPKLGGAAVTLRVRIDGDDVALDGSIGAVLAGAAFAFSSDV